MKAERIYRLGVLGSGLGSTFQAIAEFCRDESNSLEIKVVLSDLPSSGIMCKSEALRIPCFTLDPGNLKYSLGRETELKAVDILKNYKVDLVVLAGFMRILKKPFLSAFPKKILNIHPSLLPDFPGLKAWKQALDAGVKTTGCTVHLTDEGTDTGPILAQCSVPVLKNDNERHLHSRIQAAERQLYPITILDYLRTGKF
ncbi:MAG TPA: phosphoribosylglycinamide formyltransferase [Verrucomicrobiales bacterium]|nr:phosphoribosylglycinamide formyltransferase [Verrucomicrobiales bacterium]HIL69577.1 phosphoribosylglycinamide formyltransferase [Verrucomicrobiota bacterium]